MDIEAQVMELERKVAGLEADVHNLVGWQHTQNGTIARVDEKVDKLQFWMMGTAAGAALTFLGTVITLLVIVGQKG